MGVAGCPGIPGRIKSVWVAGYYRYRWPDHPGIRTDEKLILIAKKNVFSDAEMTYLRVE
jgi:hypothetical protein